MYLDELFDWKNQFMKDILTHENIYSLLKADATQDEAYGLAYTQVFPYEYIPDTIEEAKTYICFDIDVQETYNKNFLEPTLTIWILTHKSLLRLPEGGVRTDKLCSEITKVINGSRYYGLGELNISSVRRFAPLMDYQGKSLVFRAKEINRIYDPVRKTPSNRKEG